MNLLDVLEFEGGWDLESEIPFPARPARSPDQPEPRPVRNKGWSVFLLAYRISVDWLDDSVGKRYERHVAYAWELNLLRLHRIWRRLEHGDYCSRSENLDAGFPFPAAGLLGTTFRANPRLTFGVRHIDAFQNGIRDGQHAWFFGFSL